MVTEWYASGNRVVCEAARKRQRGGVCAGYALALSDTVVPSRAHHLVRKLTRPPRKYGRLMQPICNKIALESKLSRDFLANVHFLLYLCAQIALLCAMMNHIEQF